MSFSFLGIGSAVPSRSILQADAARLAATFANAEPGRERALEALYRQTRIRSRGSVLLEDSGGERYRQSFFPPAASGDASAPSTALRMRRYAEEAPALAVEAATAALSTAAVAPEAITHLVTCSCTGFSSPGFDLAIVESLGLAPSVARTHVGFMGCHGAFNTLRVAAAFAASDPRATVLAACVELCSLHFQYGTRSDDVVANSIFADGAGAFVGRAAIDEDAWRLTAQLSCVLPGSAELMGWTIGDNGFEMTLSSRVPDRIAATLPQLIDELLECRGLDVGDVASWAVHPGGPRVLAGVREALGLGPERLRCSEGVLAEHGNMSSATILFILERLMLERAARPCVAMAFGPGLTAELALFE